MSDNPFIVDIKNLITDGECAPAVGNKDAVCSSDSTIADIKKWLVTEELDSQKIIELAKERTSCSSESCLYSKINGLNVRDLDTRFKAKGPWDSTNWLDNKNIDDVLQRYARKFPRFYHCEFQMRDFAAQPGNELAVLDFVDLSKKYDAFGVVLNTDLTNSPGEHWVCCFVDFRGKTVEYFDSAGQPPKTEFLEFCIKTASELGFRDVMVTKVQHQTGQTECGIYSLFYILCRLHGVAYKQFEYKRIPDDVMIDFRKYLFRRS